MRLFFASFLGAASARHYARLVRQVADRSPGLIRPVPSKTHHLTLAFLGEVDGNELERCLDVLDLKPAPDAFPISLEPPRVLYGRGQPRLILAEVGDGAAALSDLQERICRGLRESFPGRSLRPKPPHATLARFRKGLRRGPGRRVESALAELAEAAVPTRDVVAAVHLVESTLTPSGPVYESVAHCRLAVAGARRGGDSS